VEERREWVAVYRLDEKAVNYLAVKKQKKVEPNN